MRVAILGSGPAGLISAHAAAMQGATVAVFGTEKPSQLHGAQYLHQPIPGIDCGQPTTVTYHLTGDIDGYRRKVYDNLNPEFVSPEHLTGSHEAWDIRKTYADLWRRFQLTINPFWVKDGNDFWAQYGQEFLDYFDLVVSTIPRRRMCMYPDKHEFIASHIYASGDAPELGQYCPVQAAKEGEIICNGEDSPAWYRVSRIHGYTTAEWPGRRQPPFNTVGKVTKPVRHNCGCFPEIVHVGRYGAWKKGYLAHEAYDTVVGKLKYMENEGIQEGLFPV